MGYKTKTAVLVLIAVLSIVAYLTVDVGRNWEYVLTRRSAEVLAMLITGSAIAFSTLVFQTVTHNRILTPSIIGLDSLYLLIQTLVVFLFGSSTAMSQNPYFNFAVSVVLMVLFSIILFQVLFRSGGEHVYFLLLIGLIVGIFFNSISSFMQVMIDPNEFMIVQDRMFASINNINRDLLGIAGLLMVLTVLYAMRFYRYLDVLTLGKEHAISLGVEYDQVVKQLLIVVSILVAVSTALTGPITFLGLLVVNVAYELLKTYRHQYLILGSALISIIALVAGQLVVKKVFTFSIPLSVIINFLGGVYFIYLLLKESRA